MAAAKKGVHVICEKPIVTDIDDAEKIQFAVVKNKVVIFPVLNYKRSPLIQKMKEMVWSGKIGKIKTATINVFRPNHRDGVPEWIPHWRRQKKYAGGGVLMDYGPHVFSLIQFLFNEKPLKITAKTSILGKNLPETDDNVFVRLEFKDKLIKINLSWTAEERSIIYEINGTRGSLISRNNILDISTAKGASREIYQNLLPIIHPNWFFLTMLDFIKAIKYKNYESNELCEALDGIKLISRAYDSCKNNSETILL